MKQRKPILALLVAAALLPWLTVSAMAADTDVMFSDPSVVVGNTVTVNVYTTSAVAGIDLTLVYDTDYLTYTGASGGLGNAAVQDNGGSLRIVDYSSSGEGKFSLNLSFTARAIGTTALRPTACSASNAGGDAVSVEYASHSASVTITSASSDCTLSALYIDPGTLSPAFSANVTNYAVTVPYETTWLAVSAVKNDASATTAVSGNGSLSVGLNYVTVTVTAGNGAQRVYTLAVTRQAQDTAAQPTSDNHVDTTEPEIPEATPAAGRTIFTAEGRTYTILDAAMLSVQPPEGCVLGDYALLGSVCRAYLPGDGGEYVVFYARAGTLYLRYARGNDAALRPYRRAGGGTDAGAVPKRGADAVPHAGSGTGDAGHLRGGDRKSPLDGHGARRRRRGALRRCGGARHAPHPQYHPPGAESEKIRPCRMRKGSAYGRSA